MRSAHACDAAMVMNRAAGIGAALCLMSTVMPATVVAQAPEGAFTLHWSAPPSCPDHDEVMRRISRWARVPVATLQQRIVVLANIEAEGDDFHLHLQLETASGTSVETLRAHQCRRLADVVALKTALAVAPLGVAETADEDASTPPSRTADTVVTSQASRDVGDHGRDASVRERTAESSPLSDSASWAVALDATAGPTFALFSGPAFGLEVAATLERGDWALRLGGQHVPEHRVRFRDPTLSRSGADVLLTLSSLSGCRLLRAEVWQIQLCAGPELGGMRGEGIGLGAPETSWRLFVGFSTGAMMRAGLFGNVDLIAGTQLAFVLVRPGFQVDDVGPLYRAPWALPRFWLGLSAHLP